MDDLKKNIKVSIILPAYNEEKKIGESIEKVDDIMRTSNFDYEIIIVDDGSHDATKEIALKYAKRNNHIRVISHPWNLGKGAAIKTGFLNSKGDLIAFIDSDLEIDPQHIRLYINALKIADIAIGSKWHPESKVKISFTRRLLSRSFYALVKLLVGIKVSDTQVGLKAFRKEALEKIIRLQFIKRYSFDVEMLAIASLLNLKIIELPVNINLNSKFSIKEILRMLMELLGVTYRLRIQRMYQILLRCYKNQDQMHMKYFNVD